MIDTARLEAAARAIHGSAPGRVLPYEVDPRRWLVRARAALLAADAVDPLRVTPDPDGYRPGCSKPGCVCQTPPPVCREYLPDAHDAHCVRCGWVEPEHPGRAARA